MASQPKYRFSWLLALLLVAPTLAGCLGGEDAGLASHDEPLVLAPSSASGTGWTNPLNVVTDDDNYASTSTHEVFLSVPITDSTFTGTITKVQLNVDQQLADWKDDSWVMGVYQDTCGDMGYTFANPTASRSVLSADITCPNGWTWDRINAATAWLYTSKSGGVDGEWRAFHAWLEVTFTNNVPVAGAGNDQNVTESTTVTLDGSASADADGARDPLTYLWTQVAGPSVTLANPATATPSFTAPTLSTNTPVDLEFELTVTDPNLDADTDLVTVTVENVNNAPVAHAGSDQAVAEATNITLDGAASSDPDADTLTYAWTQTAGTTVTLSDASAAAPSFTAPDVPDQGSLNLTFQLVVNDGFTSSAPDDVTVRVDNVNVAPTVSAGADQTVDEEALVNLTAAGDDPDGDALTYQWTQTAGTPVTLAGASTSTTSFTAPTLPTNDDVTLAFSVTVSDGLLLSAESTVNVVVQNVNQAPVASAGSDQTVEEAATVTLDGSASTDPDADALAHSWTQTTGPTVTLSDATSARPTFVAPDVPTNDPILLTFQLSVNDGALDSAADTITVTVQNINQPPVSQAGPDQTIDEAMTVTLDGTGSNDADQDPLAYNWTQTDGPSVTLTAATTAQPSFTAPTLPTNDPITLTFSLVVGDGQELSAADTVTVTAENINQPPAADAGPDQTLDETAAATLDATASTDADADPLTFAWSQTSGPVVTLSDAAAAQPTFTAPNVPTNEPVTLVFRLVVHDGYTLSAADNVTITVENVNQPPSLEPLADVAVDEQTPVTVAAEATDPDQDSLSYAWTQTAGPSVSLDGAATAAVSFTAPAVPTSTDVVLTFEVRVDDGIAAPIVDAVDVTVRNVNTAPLVEAGMDQTVDEGTDVLLNGTVTDPDADAFTFTWTQTGGPSVMLANASTLTPVFVAPTLANSTTVNLTFRLNATDGSLASADAVVVAVHHVNQAPVAAPGGDQVVAAESFVTLDGSGSHDPDGDSLAFAWTQTGGPSVTLAGASTATPTFTAPSTAETVVVTLVVTDSSGAASAPKSVLVTTTSTSTPTSPTPASPTTTAPTTTPSPDAPAPEGAAAFPSSLRLAPGDEATVRILGIDESGASLLDTGVECAWDDALAGGSLAPVDGDPCRQVYTAGATPGLNHHLVATVTGADGDPIEIIVPVSIAFVAEETVSAVGEPDAATSTCIADMPPVDADADVPILFGAGCGLHSVSLRGDQPTDAPTQVRVRVVADNADLPPDFTGPAALVIDVEWTTADGTPVDVREATIQFLVTQTWRDAACPGSVCGVVMYHGTDGLWNLLNTTLVGRDANAERYLATTTDFSVFAAGGVPPQIVGSPAPPTDPDGMPGPWTAVLAVAVLAILIVGTTVLVRGRQRDDAPSGVTKAPGPQQGSLAAMLREIRQDEIVRFVNSAAHDMASPVSTLAVQLHLLTRDDRPLDADDKKRLATMTRNVEQLRRLVSDLRDGARLQADKFEMERERIDLAATLRETAESLGAKASAAGIALTVDASEPVEVDADPGRIDQVLTNLVENALRFTSEGGSIGLRLTVEDDEAVVRVADTGIGMTAEQKDHLFQPFVQVHEQAQRAGGSGLGLYISQGIIKRHGGGIEVETTEPGHGTVFRFTLPLVAPQADPSQP